MKTFKNFLLIAWLGFAISCSDNSTNVKVNQNKELELAIEKLKASGVLEKIPASFGKIDLSKSRLVEIEDVGQESKKNNLRTTCSSCTPPKPITQQLETPLYNDPYTIRRLTTTFFADGTTMSFINEFVGYTYPIGRFGNPIERNKVLRPLSDILSTGVLSGRLTTYSPNGQIITYTSYHNHEPFNTEVGTDVPDASKGCVNDCVHNQYNTALKSVKVLCWIELLAGCLATWMVHCSFECGCVLGC